MGLLRRISAVGGLTMVSRVFGFARDVLMARTLGAGFASDAFFIAFKLPNFFRRLFAEGAFSAGFVPLISAVVGREQDAAALESASLLAKRILAWFLPVLLAFLLLMEVFMVPVMLGLTGGYGNAADGADKLALTVLLGRLTFPYLVFISLVAFFSAILNAFDRFSAAALCPVLLNIFMISALVFFPGDTAEEAAQALAASVALSGAVQAGWLWYACHKMGVRLSFERPRLSPELKQLLSLVAPAAIGAGVMQINLLVDVMLAARLLEDGAVSWLFYSDRLNQLPVGVIGVAIGTVILPSMSRSLASGDTDAASHAMTQALRYGLMVALPAAVGLMLAADPIIITLFERGAFSDRDTAMTAAALSAYALGLPAYILMKCLTPGFHARRDTKTPVKIAMVTLVVNVAANLALIGPMGHVGLAAATALAAWVGVILSYTALHRSQLYRAPARLVGWMLRIILAALVMGLVVYVLTETFSDIGDTLIERALYTAGLVGLGGLAYGFALIGFGGVRLSELKALRRR